MTFLNILGAIVGLANLVVVSHLFGTSRHIEIYFAAVGLLMTVEGLTQTGQIVELFLPVYHRTRHEMGRKDAERAFAVLVNWTMLFVIALTLLLWIASPVLIRLRVPGFPREVIELGVQLSYALLPLVCVDVLIAMMQMLANAERLFGKPEFVTVCSKIIIVAGIALLARPFGIWAMVISLWIGQILAVIMLAFILYWFGYRHTLSFRMKGFTVWSLYSKLLATLTYAGATQIYFFVLDAALSMLPPGVFAVFKYVQQMFARTSSVFLRPISIVFFTSFSEAVAGRASRLKQEIESALAKFLAIACPVAVIVWIAARPAFNVVLASDKFSLGDIQLAAILFSISYLQLFPLGSGQIARKAAISLGLSNTLYLAATISQLVSAGIVFVLVRQFSVGGAIVGTVLASLALTASFFVPIILSHRDLFIFYRSRLCIRWGIACAFGWLAGFIVSSITNIGEWEPKWVLAVFSLALASVGGGITVAVAWILKIHEVREAIRRSFLYLAQLAAKLSTCPQTNR
jgi:putative peptidoglycan lipid II flippase